MSLSSVQIRIGLPHMKTFAYFLTILAAALLFLSGTVTSAKAEVIDIDKQKLFDFPSTDEDVGLTLLKLAKVRDPEFAKLVVRTETYKTMAPEMRAGFLQTETPRLAGKYATINPQEEGVLIRLGVKVYFKDGLQDNPPILTIQFPSSGLIYFPYFYAGIPIAVIPNGIENFTTIVLSEDERNIVNATLDPSPEATLVLSLKPVGADIKSPMMLDGEKQLPLLCEISYIGVHNRNTDQVWAWGSDTYKVNGRKTPMIEIVRPEKGAPF
ncbi:MAG: hypothetical protein AUJ12_08745 [Alphaproteobacteria bacterium CG1_02_46_17]|nr:MAG: hypothetical protein AUJ12_08745 [Alphaproteobacteria bacterium CG1_02_46_17]